MIPPTARILVIPSLLLVAGSAFAQTTNTEIEPNSNKGEATTPAVCLASGDSLSGTTTGTSTTAGSSLSTTVDVWRIQTCPASLGIYRHQLVITTSGTAGHTSTLRGLNQGGTPGSGGTAGTTDTTIQLSTAATVPPRMNQWYGFGQGEELYFRCGGNASTTAPYTGTLTTTPVTPVFVGTFAAGDVTIDALGQLHTTDTDMWLYDGNLSAMPGHGNDDPAGTNGSPSYLERFLAPGTYYVAMTNYNLANDRVATIDDGWVEGPLTDFPDIAVNSSAAVGVDCSFTVADSSGPAVQVNATKSAPFEILWFRFDVTGSITAYCFGDGTGATACPCGNTGQAGKGCDNSAVTGGAQLSASGTTNPDTIVLMSTGELASALSIFLQGNANLFPPPVFGDGVRCAGGSLKRLYVKNASAGTVSAPTGTDPSITTQSAALGDTILPGTSRYYQVYYRDPDLSFCASPPGNSWNVSNGLLIPW